MAGAAAGVELLLLPFESEESMGAGAAAAPPSPSAAAAAASSPHRPRPRPLGRDDPPLPAELVLVLLEPHVGVDAAAGHQLEAHRRGPVRGQAPRVVEEPEVLARVAVVRRVLGALLVARLPEARLAEEDDAAGHDPRERARGQAGHLRVAEVHQQPVGEEHVDGARGQLQLGRVPDGEPGVPQVAVDALVLGDEVGHKVDREHGARPALSLGGQGPGEAADAGAELDDAGPGDGAQEGEDLFLDFGSGEEV